MDDDTRMLNPRQVAEILGVHQKTVHLWLRSGKLKGTKISYRAWRIPQSALDSFIEVNSNTRVGPQTRSSLNVDGKPDPVVQSAEPKEKITEGPVAGGVSPQSRMKHYIRDIMGEKPHE
jgi:excisionase family DNA binding protein